MLLVIALLRLRRHVLLYGLFGCLVGLGVAAYLAAAPLTGGAVERATAAVKPLPLPATAVVELPYEFVRLIILGDPEAQEAPRTERRLECLYSEEAMAGWRGLPWVKRVELGRLAPVTSPWGRLWTLAVPPGSWVLEGKVRLESGRLPAASDEVLMPAALAARPGAAVGDRVALGYLSPGPNPASHVFTETSFLVVGTFRAELSFLDRPLLAIAGEGWPCPGLPDPSRPLTSAGPNILFFQLKDGYPPAAFRAWLTEPDRREGHRVYPGPRYPVGQFWSVDTPRELARLLVGWAFFPATQATLGAFGFLGFGLFAVMLGAFLERRRELAVLKAVGFDAALVGRLLALETALVGAAGATAGLALGGWLTAFLTPWYPPGAGLTPRSAVEALAYAGLTLSVAVAFPVALARVATVNQLLLNQPIYLARREIRREYRG